MPYKKVAVKPYLSKWIKQVLMETKDWYSSQADETVIVMRLWKSNHQAGIRQSTLSMNMARGIYPFLFKQDALIWKYFRHYYTAFCEGDTLNVDSLTKDGQWRHLMIFVVCVNGCNKSRVAVTWDAMTLRWRHDNKSNSQRIQLGCTHHVCETV